MLRKRQSPVSLLQWKYLASCCLLSEGSRAHIAMGAAECGRCASTHVAASCAGFAAATQCRCDRALSRLQQRHAREPYGSLPALPG